MGNSNRLSFSCWIVVAHISEVAVAMATVVIISKVGLMTRRLLESVYIIGMCEWHITANSKMRNTRTTLKKYINNRGINAR